MTPRFVQSLWNNRELWWTLATGRIQSLSNDWLLAVSVPLPAVNWCRGTRTASRPGSVESRPASAGWALLFKKSPRHPP